MRIANIEMTKQGFIAAVSAVVVIAIFLIYTFVYMPLIHKLKTSYLECKLCENQLADARNIIGLAGKTNSDKILVAEKDALLAMDELTKHGKEMKVDFVSMKPGDIAIGSDGDYKTLPIDMDIEASDEQFANFLGSLDNLKKAVIKVKSFDAIPDEKDRTKLKARLTVNMYLSKRDYAE